MLLSNALDAGVDEGGKGPSILTFLEGNETVGFPEAEAYW